MLGRLAVLAIGLAVCVTTAQTPEFNIYTMAWSAPAGGGIYHLNTSTGNLRKINNENGKGAMLSPDGKQIAYATYGHNLKIMNNDGTNVRQVPGVGMNTDLADAFAWTDRGIYWVHHDRDLDRDTFFCYNPTTGQLKMYPPFQAKPGATSFGGCWASTDGTRMFTWITQDIPEEPQAGTSSESKPYYYFNNGNFDTPVIRRAYFWGHGNTMLPNGKYLLGVLWPESSDPVQGNHPYLKTWDLDNFRQGPSYVFPLQGDKNIVPVVNSSEWIVSQMGDENSSTNNFYVWKFATSTTWDRVFTQTGHRVMCGWMGALPSPLAWAITEPSVTLTDASRTATLHVTGWTDAGNPTVTSSKTWVGPPTISRSSSNVTIVYTVANPPVLRDTAVITVRDAASATQLTRIIFTPSQTPAERMTINTSVTTTNITLSWTNVLGGSYTFAVRESLATGGWSARQTATTSYVDADPRDGTNVYRVYAIGSATDTTSQRVSASFTAPSSITITSPTEGQTFAPGQQITIRWTGVRVGTVNVYVSLDGGDSLSRLNSSGIVEGTPQWGSFQVTLPSTSNTSVMYFVRHYTQLSLLDMVTVSTTGSGAVSPAAELRRGAQSTATRYDLRGRVVHGHTQPTPSAVIRSGEHGSSVEAQVGK